MNFIKKIFHCFRCGYSGVAKALGIPLQSSNNDGRILEDKPIKIPGFYPFRGFTSLCSLQFLTLLQDFLGSRGLEFLAVVDKGWGWSEDLRLRNRLIIPIKEKGQVVCYIARAFKGQEPKELCPSGEISNRSHFLYNLDAIVGGERVVVVEGIFDCEALVRQGYNSVAVMGSHLSDIQVGKLLAKKPSMIHLMFDGDDAGRKGAMESYKKLIRRFSGIVRISTAPEGKDPDELSIRELRKLLD